jgi:hypothetical protein
MFSQGVVMIHVMRDGQQFGPYTIEDINTYLAQGTLLPTDQAWYEGAANWMLITEVPGVVHGAAPAPVVAEADPMAAANPEVAVAEAGAAAAAVGGAKKKKLIIIGGSVAGVVAIAGVLLFVYPGFLKDDEADGGGGNNGGGASGGGQNFAGIVEPIFKRSTCYDCHDAATAKGSFNLDDLASVQEAITVGDPDGSELVKRLVDPTEDVRMPPKGDMLPATDVQKIKDWIAAGAQF